MILSSKSRKFLLPHNVFLILVINFGGCFLFIIPPFQCPDEPEHFYRAYQISQGDFTGQKENQRLGGMLPQGVVDFVKPFYSLRWSTNKTTLAATFSNANLKLKDNEPVFKDFPNTAVYPPLAYLPQAFMIWVSRILHFRPLLIFYCARLGSLLSWIFLAYLAIKIIPGFKWLFVFLALLPMALFENSTVNADVFTNGISFLLIAFVFKSAFSDNALKIKDLAIITLLGVLLASSKIVYALLVTSSIIIPSKKFSSAQRKYFFIAGMFGCVLLAMIFWSSLVNKLYIPYNAYNPAHLEGIGMIDSVDIHKQLGYIKSHPLYPFIVVAVSLVKMYSMYLPGYIGIFGWLELQLPVWLVLVAYAVILVVTFFDGKNSVSLTQYDRMILVLTFLITLGTVLFSQLLNWTHTGGDLISSTQGRYFIPALPVLFLGMTGTSVSARKFVSATVTTASVGLFIFSIITIYRHYYVSLW